MGTGDVLHFPVLGSLPSLEVLPLGPLSGPGPWQALNCVLEKWVNVFMPECGSDRLWFNVSTVT